MVRIAPTFRDHEKGGHIMATRITSKHVHEQLDWLKEELVDADMRTVDARWDVQEGSATYGRAWRVYVGHDSRLPFHVANQLGGAGGYLGDTAKDALETVRGARRILCAIIETQRETQRETLEQLAVHGVVAASLTLSLMDDGFTYTDALAAATALAVSQ